MSVIIGKYAIMRNPMLTTFDLNFSRGVVSMLVAIIQSKFNGYSITTYSKQALLVLIPINLISLIRSYSLVVAYTYISGTKSLLISNVAPIMIVIMGGFILHEKVSKFTYLLALLTCFG